MSPSAPSPPRPGRSDVHRLGVVVAVGADHEDHTEQDEHDRRHREHRDESATSSAAAATVVGSRRTRSSCWRRARRRGHQHVARRGRSIRRRSSTSAKLVSVLMPVPSSGGRGLGVRDRTVAGRQSSVSAISASVRSEKYRRTTTTRCRSGSVARLRAARRACRANPPAAAGRAGDVGARSPVDAGPSDSR